MARGEDFGDVDVSYVWSAGQGESWCDLARLQGDLDEALHDLVERVDLVDEQKAPPPLMGAILKEGVVVLEHEPDARAHFDAERMLVWLDSQPVWERQWELRRKARRARWASGER